METDSSLPLIASLGFLLLMSAFFSASETAYSSLNPVRLKSMITTGENAKGATRALTLVGRYDKLLSTVLVGNNIVNIASSSLATVLFVGWFGNAGVSLATLVMTVLVLMFGEVSPKTLAKEQPEKFAIFAALPLMALSTVLRPVNAFFSAWKRLLLRLFHIKGGQNMTEEELLAYVDEAHEDGGINEVEAGMIRQVIEFNDLEVDDILTPRVDMLSVSLEDSMETIERTFHESGFSRLPVYGRSEDNIKGVLLQKDYWFEVIKQKKSLEEVVKPVVFVTKQVKISKLLEQLQQKKCHIAIVVDEYGGTVGLVTVEDILEQLVGDIWDEHENVVQAITRESDSCYRVLGSTDVDDFFETFLFKGEIDSATVGGWVTEQLGRFPEVGESFLYEGWNITVTKTMRQRVLEIVLDEEPFVEETGKKSEE